MELLCWWECHKKLLSDLWFYIGNFDFGYFTNVINDNMSLWIFQIWNQHSFLIILIKFYCVVLGILIFVIQKEFIFGWSIKLIIWLNNIILLTTFLLVECHSFSCHKFIYLFFLIVAELDLLCLELWNQEQLTSAG